MHIAMSINETCREGEAGAQKGAGGAGEAAVAREAAKRREIAAREVAEHEKSEAEKAKQQKGYGCRWNNLVEEEYEATIA